MIQRQGLGVVGGTASSDCGLGPRGYLDVLFLLHVCKAAQHIGICGCWTNAEADRREGRQRTKDVFVSTDGNESQQVLVVCAAAARGRTAGIDLACLHVRYWTSRIPFQ